MAGMSSPINITSKSTTPREAQYSKMPGGRNGDDVQATAMDIVNGTGRPSRAMSVRLDSISEAQAPGGYSSGAQPMSLSKDRPRRESMASSIVGGMSFGGVSVGSWIRDDIIMQGTSPFAYSSPSFHSSSYLPKLEANFMKDFRCCDLTLPTMHDLQRHYEERHSQEMPHSYNRKADQSPQPDNKAALANGAATAVKEQALKDEKQKTPQPSGPPTATQSPTIPTPTQIIPQRRRRASSDFAPPEFPLNQDMDPLQDLDMEMEEPTRPPQQQTSLNAYQLPRLAQAPRLGQPAHDRTPSLNLDQLRIGIPLQHHQGLRTSTPTTPIGRGGPVFQHNPTVSSVNTPTLTAFPTHQQAQYIPTPDSSAPGTPGELDAPFGAMSVNPGYMPGQPTHGGYYPWGNGQEMLDLCIDEPAKRLYALNGLKPPKSSVLQPPSRLGDNQYSENSEVAKTIREQQRIAGVPEPPNDGVPKPFHCPVIGCEKAYKNQNGLKYHKAHGHNTQQLAANSNGTFSIVDPDTHEVYPGTVGMEKHKPYRCGTCGKRYKNLNGLKYHKNHSPTCDPNDDPQGSRPTSRPTSSGSPAVGQAGFGTGFGTGIGTGIGGAPTTFANNPQSNLGIPGAVGGI